MPIQVIDANGARKITHSGLAITAGKTLTVQESLILTGASGKTLTLTDSLTVQGGGATTLSSAGNYALTLQESMQAAGRNVANTFTAANAFAEIISANKGVAFPAIQVASADANTLDDYEEGTWTPVVFGSGTSGTYESSSATGTYTKVGRVVTYSYDILFAPVVTGGGAGNLVIGGFPFPAAGGHQGSFGIYHFGISTTSAIPLGGPSDGSATSPVISTTAAGGQTIEAIGIVVANGYLRSAGHYIV